MADKFKVGDIVRLKSGSPNMTVNGSYSDYVDTTWFAGKKHERARFAEDALVMAEDDEK